MSDNANIVHRVFVDSDEDSQFSGAVRDGVTVLEDGGFGPGHQYRAREVKIEIVAVRTWLLEYVGEGKGESPLWHDRPKTPTP